MQRRTFVAFVTSEDGKTHDTKNTYAWNSAIRATETMMRAIARAEGQPYSGERPDVSGGKPGESGALYTRAWIGDRTGRLFVAAVAEATE